MRRKVNHYTWIARGVGPLLFALLVAGVVWTWPKQQPSTGAVATIVPLVPLTSVTTTARILLGVPVPGASSDKLFLLSLPERTVEEQAVSSSWRLTALDADRLSLAVKPSTKGDGVFFLSGPPDWNVPLRARGGAAYADPVLLGQFDSTHAALTASRDEPYLLSVSRAGAIRELYHIPEQARALSLQQGSVWFATAQPGEGIESPLQGPSSLINVSRDGVASVAATDTQVIVDAIAGPANALAYLLDNDEMIVRATGITWTGQGTPLLWLDAHTLVFARGTSVFLLDGLSPSPILLANLPAAPMIGILKAGE